MSQAQRTSLKNLQLAYLTAFLLVIILATSAQGLIQWSLYQEIIYRQASALVGSQAVHSQRLQRNAVLLLGAGDHRALIAEMSTDVATLESNKATFIARYSSYFPELAHLNGGKAAITYAKVVQAAHMLIQLEPALAAKHLTEKARLQQELPWISQLFYSEKDQLTNIEQSRQIVDTAADAYIVRIRLVEIVLYSLTVLVLCAEGLFVLRPSFQHFHRLLHEDAEPSATTPQQESDPSSSPKSALSGDTPTLV